MISSQFANGGLAASSSSCAVATTQQQQQQVAFVPLNDVIRSQISSTSCIMKHLKDLNVQLCHEDLWKEFHDINHEMKITNTGRPMFPVLSLKISGLEPTALYSLAVNFANADFKRYRYSPVKNEWINYPVVKRDPATTPLRTYYEHPSSPSSGDVWTAYPVSFASLRLTNNRKLHNMNMIQLSSLQKYRIQVIVGRQCEHCAQPHLRMIDLPLTEFIAVTGYKNTKIVRLKIEKNPSSAAFRNGYKQTRESNKRKREKDKEAQMKKWMDEVSKSCNTRSPDTQSSSSRNQSPIVSRPSCRYQSSGTLTATPPSVHLDAHGGNVGLTSPSCRDNFMSYPVQHDAIFHPSQSDVTCYQPQSEVIPNASQSAMLRRDVMFNYPPIPGPGLTALDQSPGGTTCYQPQSEVIYNASQSARLRRDNMFNYPPIPGPGVTALDQSPGGMPHIPDIDTHFALRIPDIRAEYTRLVHRDFTYPWAVSNGRYNGFNQSNMDKYEDFVTPVQYTEWDTIYY